MRFSLITPTHNPHYLSYLADSIFNQTFTDWEWIIYMNGGAYNKELPSKFMHPQIRIIRDPNINSNIGYLKNSAFKCGSGEILVEVDHDDLLTENCLEVLDREFSNETVGFVYSDNAKLPMWGQIFTPYGSNYGWSHRKFNWNGTELYAMNSFEPDHLSISFIWYMPDHVRAWRSTIYNELGGHDVSLSVLDDQDLIIRTYLHTTIKHVPEVLYIYRIYGNNTWLERNAEIQRNTVELYHKYGIQVAERWADLNGLLKIDIGGGLFPKKGYKSVDVEGGDITADLNGRFPFDDNSVGIVRASHVIEHLNNPIHTMNEIHRILIDKGIAHIEVPSTDGRGAFMDPTHKSFWNEYSFLYYTNKDQGQFIRNNTCRFQSFRCQTHFSTPFYERMGIPVVTAWLAAIKTNASRPHLVNI